jgi:hypothetical protein
MLGTGEGPPKADKSSGKLSKKPRTSKGCWDTDAADDDKDYYYYFIIPGGKPTAFRVGDLYHLLMKDN